MLSNQELDKLMGEPVNEPVYNKSLVEKLHRAFTEEVKDAEDLVDAGYVTVSTEGKWNATPSARSFLDKDYPPEDKQAIEAIQRFIKYGDLVYRDGVYHVTKRGRRSIARFFRSWLFATNKSMHYDRPPEYIELLDIDGTTEETVNRALYSKWGNRSWKLLRKNLMATLTPEQLGFLSETYGRPEKKQPKISERYSRLVADAVQDGKDEQAGINPFKDEAWGTEE